MSLFFKVLMTLFCSGALYMEVTQPNGSVVLGFAWALGVAMGVVVVATELRRSLRPDPDQEPRLP